ncbi:MAG: amidohydrolase family protein, partial [Dehalococcoidia bacterium]
MQGARVDTVVHGGSVVTSTHAYEASIAIKGEQIVAVGPMEVLPPADNYIDAGGKYVLPGAIDCHVHFGNADDYQVGTTAAAYAGLTTVMPFGVVDSAGEETLPQAITRLKEEVARHSVVDVAFHLILGNPPYIVESIPEAVRMGVSSFKMFMNYKKQVTRMCSDAYIARVMEIVSAHGGIVQLHCENGDIIDYLEDKAIAEGRTHPRDFPATCPVWVEEEAINRA